jgi:hypothetical protein
VRRIHFWGDEVRRRGKRGSLCGERDNRAKHLIAQGCRQGARAPSPAIFQYYKITALVPHFTQPIPSQAILGSPTANASTSTPRRSGPHSPTLFCRRPSGLVQVGVMEPTSTSTRPPPHHSTSPRYHASFVPGRAWASLGTSLFPHRPLKTSPDPRCSASLSSHSADVKCSGGSASATYYRFEGLDVYLACAVIFPTPHDIPLPQIDSSSMRATSSIHFSSWPGQRSDKLSAFAFFSHPLP